MGLTCLYISYGLAIITLTECRISRKRMALKVTVLAKPNP
jgi:hypothetical protein